MIDRDDDFQVDDLVDYKDEMFSIAKVNREARTLEIYTKKSESGEHEVRHTIGYDEADDSWRIEICMATKEGD